jgi:hypothetical protein
MANPQHLEILKQGVEVWNEWRKENLDVEPDLEGANLSGANLEGASLFWANLKGANLSKTYCVAAYFYEANLAGANFFRADLTGSNLEAANLKKANFNRANFVIGNLAGANLSEASFFGTYLEAANLSRTNLFGAKLIATHALGVNFEQSILTGACIENWNISNETNFQGIKCDYIYLKYDYKLEKFTERRPHDPDQIFAPGDFEAKIQRSLEKKYKKIIKNKEQQHLREIKFEKEKVFFYEEQLERERSDRQLLLRMIQNMAEQQQSPKYQFNNPQIENWAEQNQGIQSGGGIHNYAPESKQSLAEAAAEIQKLLEQLSQIYSPEKAEQKVAEDLAERAKKDPSFKQSLKNWSQSLLGKGSETAVVETVKEGVKRVIPLAISLLI